MTGTLQTAAGDSVTFCAYPLRGGAGSVGILNPEATENFADAAEGGSGCTPPQ